MMVIIKTIKIMKKIFNNRNAYLLFGLLQFGFFAYDMEYHRTIWTWGWLLMSQLNLMKYLIERLAETKKENIRDITNSTIIIK
jgi:hypothetical protein